MSFKTPLIIEDVAGREWRLTAPLVYDVPGVLHVEVPAGFQTDLASVPRIVMWCVPHISEFSRAATLHDYLYRVERWSRTHADAVFHRAMLDEGVGRISARMIYLAVRLFGWLPWWMGGRGRKSRRTS